MKNIIENKLKLIEESIANNHHSLRSLMQYQISLEKQLQELILTNESPTIAIRGAKKIDFVSINEIIYCVADLSYTEIITESHTKLLASKSINDYEKFLSHYCFYRISKSLLVNVKQIHSYDRQNNKVIMKNRDVLDVARRRKSDFLNTILSE